MRALFALVVPALLLTGPAAAKEIEILVANKGTPAYENAKKKENDDTVFAERRLHKALNKAAKLLNKKCPKCPEPRVRGLKPPPCDIKPEDFCSVNIKVAHGAYTGKGGAGGFSVKELINRDSTLRILGGYDDKFEKRAPFDTPTRIDAGGTAIAFSGKNPKLKELYVSGFTFDLGPGNKYDAKTNSLLKGSSATRAALTFGYFEVERLVIADNAFLNSSQSAAGPLIRAHDDTAEVIVRNNFIINNVLAWVAKSATHKYKPARYVLEGNSFLFNWPYNPDPTTANPAALEIGNKYTAAKVVVKDNLFAHNVGGAIYPEFADEVGPPMAIERNLFFQNGALFGEATPEGGAVVGKFGGFKSQEIPWNVLDIETVEDDYEWDSEDNVVLDPKVPLTMVKPGFANSNDVSANATVMNDVRGMLGMNKQGGTVAISNFAPRMVLDPKNLPFPKEKKAQKYGVRKDRVEQF